MIQFLQVLFLLFFLTGCPLGPDYQEPQFFTNKDLKKALEVSLISQKIPKTKITHKFQDKILTNLIQEAKENNPNLQAALIKIRSARSLVYITSTKLLPTFDITGEYNSIKASKNMEFIYNEDYYQTGFDASWELDIFGGNYRRLEAEKAGAKSVLFNLQNIWLSLESEIASNYFSLRQNEMLIQKTKENIALQKKGLSLIQSRFRSGLSNELDVKQATYLLQNTQSTLYQLNSEQEMYQDALALLVGKLPATLKKELATNHNPMDKNPILFKSKNLKMAANVLRLRPDVQNAEQLLIAQNAQVGAALSDLFPKINFTALWGWEAMHSKDLLNHKSQTHTFTPSISVPLFHFGALFQNLENQKALKEIEIQNYRQTLLTAANEIKNALTNITQEIQRNKKLYEAYQNADRISKLNFNQYLNGLINFSDVLDSEERRLNNQTNWIQSNGKLYQNWISLYKSTNGYIQE